VELGIHIKVFWLSVVFCFVCLYSGCGSFGPRDSSEVRPRPPEPPAVELWPEIQFTPPKQPSESYREDRSIYIDSDELEKEINK